MDHSPWWQPSQNPCMAASEQHPGARVYHHVSSVLMVSDTQIIIGLSKPHISSNCHYLLWNTKYPKLKMPKVICSHQGYTLPLKNVAFHCRGKSNFFDAFEPHIGEGLCLRGYTCVNCSYCASCTFRKDRSHRYIATKASKTAEISFGLAVNGSFQPRIFGDAVPRLHSHRNAAQTP